MTLEEAIAVLISLGFKAEPTQGEKDKMAQARTIVDQAAAAAIAKQT